MFPVVYITSQKIKKEFLLTEMNKILLFINVHYKIHVRWHTIACLNLQAAIFSTKASNILSSSSDCDICFKKEKNILVNKNQSRYLNGIHGCIRATSDVALHKCESKTTTV